MSLTQLSRNVKPYSIKLTPQERQKEQCIQELTQWLQDYDWGYFLTLTFKYPVYDSFRVSQAIERFINHLSGKAFGKRSAKPASFIGVPNDPFESSGCRYRHASTAYRY
ncbi:MAG: hypothetical protein ACQEUN_02790 [Pseudomonadota bacterium]